jgi:hypothetical protein
LKDIVGLRAKYGISFLHNKLAKSSKFLSPPQADGVLRNFVPSGTDFAETWNPRSKLRGNPLRIKYLGSGMRALFYIKRMILVGLRYVVKFIIQHNCAYPAK